MQLLELAAQKLMMQDVAAAAQGFEAVRKLDELSVPARAGQLECSLARGAVAEAAAQLAAVQVGLCWLQPRQLPADIEDTWFDSVRAHPQPVGLQAQPRADDAPICPGCRNWSGKAAAWGTPARLLQTQSAQPSRLIWTICRAPWLGSRAGGADRQALVNHAGPHL